MHERPFAAVHRSDRTDEPRRRYHAREVRDGCSSVRIGVQTKARPIRKVSVATKTLSSRDRSRPSPPRSSHPKGTSSLRSGRTLKALPRSARGAAYKKTSSADRPKRSMAPVQSEVRLIFPRSAGQDGAPFLLAAAVARASQGLIPPPFSMTNAYSMCRSMGTIGDDPALVNGPRPRSLGLPRFSDLI